MSVDDGNALDVVIRGGEVALPDGLTAATIGIRDGRIAAIQADDAPVLGREEIDATGRLILPGMIDLHVHFREPGLTFKEDFESGSRAAALGGVTTVGDMPNTRPPTTTGARFDEKKGLVAGKARVDYLLWAAATSPEQIHAVADAGAAGIKVYMAKPDKAPANPGTDTGPFSDELYCGTDDRLLAIFEAAAARDLLLFIHLGNPDIRRRNRAAWDGQSIFDIAGDLPEEPSLPEREAAAKCVLFARETGARIHFAHLPSDVIPIVAEAKAAGARLTAESLAPFLSFEHLGRLGPLGYDRYRTSEAIAALWDAMKSGVIDSIGTDHGPHTLAEKQVGNTDVLACPSGYPELDTVYSMLLDQVWQRTIGIADLIRLTAAAPARIAGIDDRKGGIRVGLDADLLIVDPAAAWTIDNARLGTKAGWSPFHGKVIHGRIERTILRGATIAERGEVVGEPGFGRFLVPWDGWLGNAA